MSNNIFGQEQKITINGKEYTLSRLELPLLQEILQWAIGQLPNHYEAILPLLNANIPDSLKKEQIDKAEAKMALRGSISDPETLAFLETPRGQIKMFALLLKKYHGEISEEAATTLLQDWMNENPEKMQEALAKANGTFRSE